MTDASTTPAPSVPDDVTAASAGVPPEREVLTWETFGVAARELAEQVVASGFRPEVVVAVARGGLLPGGAVAYALGTKGVGTLNVEFYTDIGQTLTDPRVLRSEEHTSELQSRENLVCRLLLEKKNKIPELESGR